jgi:hypothetical protein
MAPLRSGRPEIMEVEGEDRKLVALRVGHHRSIHEAEPEVREASIDRSRATKEAGRQEDGGVLPSPEAVA